MSVTEAAPQRVTLEILDSEVTLPTLPLAGSRLLELLQQPLDDIDIAEVARLVEADPGLYLRVLQLANSAYFGTINTITGVRQAIMHIGLEETLYSVHWLFYQNVLPKFPTLEDFTGRDYWAHSWACALANKMLGHPDLEGGVLPGDLYLAGLFHGIGKLILALHWPEEFQQCLRNAKDFSQPLHEAEQEVFGITDSFIAAGVMQLWSLPAHLCAAVEFYRSPESAGDQYRNIAALTQLAYFIANTSGIGNSGDEFCFDLNDTFIAKNQDVPLGQREIREKAAQMIYATLQKKSESVTGVEPPGKDAPEVQAKEKPTGSGLHSLFTESAGKGFWFWLRSLWKNVR